LKISDQLFIFTNTYNYYVFSNICVFTDNLFVYFRIVRFSSVHHLTIHFPSNFGADNTKVYYIGLKGDFTEVKKQ